MRNLRWSMLLGLALLLTPLGAFATPQPRLQQIDIDAFPVELISRAVTGDAAGWSEQPALSADGRYVAFQTSVSLLPEDANEDNIFVDIYVYDRETGTLEFLGIPNVSTEARYTSEGPAISGDGRFVVFSSDSPDFVPGDENEARDIFLYDRSTETYSRLNLDINGNEAETGAHQPAISDDGRYVAFTTSAALVPDDANDSGDVYIVGRVDGTLERIGGTDGGSGSPNLSAEGRYVAFHSDATDLVPGDANEASDVFVLDRNAGEIERVSVTSAGDEGNARSSSPTISADGRYVAFLSQATNLALDDAGHWHVFVHDRQSRTTEQADVSSDGLPADDDANYFALELSEADISGDGRYVVFSSGATNLTPKDANNFLSPFGGAVFDDVFMRDRVMGTTTLVSRSVVGLSGYGSSIDAALSSDGRYVAFTSSASNLTYFDNNGGQSPAIYDPTDILVRDMQAAYPDSPFDVVHDRTDLPVAEGQATRTWTWAPEPLTAPFYERYGSAEASNLLPYDLRAVQYYDKSRMEIGHPGDDPNSVWYVTNGLLVVEMMTGELQIGDFDRLQLDAAWVNVAGDAGDPNGPTYASLAGLRAAPPHPFDQPIITRVDRNGTVTNDQSLASFGVQVAVIDDVTGHAIAAPFWEFMNSSGTVWDGTAFVQDRLFENAYFATGRPIIEAYWATVLVGGEPREVLMQCFERRCLTYTPGNPDGFIVEAGNVGLHYYNWRYSVQPLAPDLTGAIVYTDGFHLNVVDQNGARSIYAAPDGLEILAPEWSPDGSQITFLLSESFGAGDLYIVSADGTNPRQLTSNQDAGSPSWSPDGARLVFESNGTITVINSDGTGRADIRSGRDPSWSPLGDRIAFVEVTGSSEHLKTMELDGSNVLDVVVAPSDSRSGTASFSGYAWSPDGSQFAYAGSRIPTASYIPTYSLHVVDVDGTDAQDIDTGGSAGPNPGWSPDGNRLTYSREHVIYAVNPDGSDVTGIVWDFSRFVRDYDWTD